METGQRGYLLTGKTAYLEPYNEASKSTRRNLRTSAGRPGTRETAIRAQRACTPDQDETRGAGQDHRVAQTGRRRQAGRWLQESDRVVEEEKARKSWTRNPHCDGSDESGRAKVLTEEERERGSQRPGDIDYHCSWRSAGRPAGLGGRLLPGAFHHHPRSARP